MKIDLPECGMLIGSPIYVDKIDYVFQSTGQYYTSWVSESHSYEWYLNKIVEENQGNLAIIWDGNVTSRCLQAMAEWMDLEAWGYDIPEPDWEHGNFLVPEEWEEIEKNKERYGCGFLKFVKKASELGLYSYSIYSEAAPQWTKKITEEKNFLGYNLGERFSFDIEGLDSEADFREKKEVAQSGYDLTVVARNFRNSVSKFIQVKQQNGWDKFLATSASFHMDAEIAAAGCSIIPHVESFAFSNLNFASALCRGLYKQFDLPLWGNYLAHEHYSFLPYSSEHKFKMLDISFLLSYMSGSKITVLESGNWWQQSDHVEDTPMHDVPKIDMGSIHNKEPHKYAHLVKDARKHYKNINYDSDICRKYRKSLSDFYDFVKANGTPEGQPQIDIAALKGNLDFCSQNYHPNTAIAGAYKIAENNPFWYEGMPERSWEIFKNVFYPLNNTVGSYKNSFFSGAPYGMTDIVSFAGKLTPEFLNENYKALLFTGWNTASEEQYELLKKYVYNGGILFLSIAHMSKNVTRNYTNYEPDELVYNGDFSELCGVKVKGRGEQLYWIIASENNQLGLEKHKRFGPFCTHRGDIEICGNPQVLAVHDESYKPCLLLNSYGKGKVYFLNSWEYPGAYDIDIAPGTDKNSKGLIGEIYKNIALQVRGSVYITDDGVSPGSNCEYITYAYFPSNDSIYMLNADFSNSREFILHKGNNSKVFNLAPSEFKIVKNI
jgi:hypothetical protein